MNVCGDITKIKVTYFCLILYLNHNLFYRYDIDIRLIYGFNYGIINTKTEVIDEFHQPVRT